MKLTHCAGASRKSTYILSRSFASGPTADGLRSMASLTPLGICPRAPANKSLRCAVSRPLQRMMVLG